MIDHDAIAGAAPTVPESEADLAPSPGAAVGRFTLESLIGSGGMGMVFAAHDPVLDRRIALKLIRGNSAEAGLRLRREAQALARLTHPNVVTVHEAGIAGHSVFIAMELVDGSNLRDWMARPHGWREIVTTFVAAGRGLAAAHAAGLVHRDFKPANVFVDRAGAVKVGDFGLVGAVAVGDDDEAGDPSSPLQASLTATGKVMGTPAYMAPEQVRGELVDERADQYAFCKSLDEALGDARPAWLARAIARGLAVEPAARWPSMTALLDRLEGTPRRRRAALVAATMIAAVGATAAAVWIAAPRQAAADPCAGDDPRLVAVWGAARRAELRAHLVAIDPASGETRFATAAPLLDGYAGEWQTMRSETCRANRVEGGQSDELFERRMRCLDRQLAGLDDSAGALATAADPVALDRALIAAHQLDGLAACADAEALMEALPPPDDPAARAEVDAVDVEVAAIERDRKLGTHDGLEPRTLAAVERARRTGHPPALAQALRARAELLFAQGKVDVAIEVLRELTEVAAAAHDDANAAWAWSELLSRLAWDLGKADDAMTILPAARAAMLRAGDDPDLRVVFLYGEATVLYGVQQEAEAHARMIEAREILEKLGAGPASSPRTGRLADMYYQDGTMYGMSGVLDQAEPLLRRAIELYTVAYGADHPETAWGWRGLADILRFDGRNEEAVVAYREVIRIREARIGETPVLAKDLISMSSALHNLERDAETTPHLDRALRILRQDDAWAYELASALMVRANIDSSAGRRDEAERGYNEAIAMFEKMGGEQVDLPQAIYNRGDMYAGMGQCDRALPDFERSVELTVTIRGADNPQLMFPLEGVGKCLVELGRPAEALPPLDRALALAPRGDQLELVTEAHLYQGRALFESGRDRAGGRRLVEQARDEAAAIDNSIGRMILASAERWLADHPR